MSKFFTSLLYTNRFRALVSRNADDEAQVDDIIQTLIEKKLRQSNLENNEGYWIKAARNLTVDIQRSNAIRERYEKNATESKLGVDSNPESQLVQAQEMETLEKALCSLSPLTRQMFALHFTQGWTYAVIAKHFGVSISTVEKRIAKARVVCVKTFRDARGVQK